MKTKSAATHSRANRRACHLLAALMITATGASAEDKRDTDPMHQLPDPDGKPAVMSQPVKVFILMGQSIQSLRKDFNAPDAKFVVATGCGNQGRESFGLQIAEAQLAVDGDSGKHPEFKGNVKTVDSRDFWREVAVSPKNQGYHYNRNAGTYMEVGNAMGWAMADLLKAGR